MNILHMHSPSWPLGGAEAYLTSLCQLQEEQGHTVAQVFLPEAESAAWTSKQAVVAPRSWGFLSGLRCCSALTRTAQGVHPDVIHLHKTQYALSPLIITALRQIAPMVLTLHDVGPICYWGTKVLRPSERLCTTPLGRSCFRSGCYTLPSGGRTIHHLYGMFLLHLQLKTYKKIDKVLVGNRYLLGELVRNGFDSDRLTYLPLFTQRGVGTTPTPQATARHILYVGRLSHHKGIFKLIQALDLIRHQDWTAELIGTGPHRREAEHEVKRRALDQQVCFVGEVPGVTLAPYYESCRVVVFPSMVLETFGLVALEAMAFAKPVVAFDCAAARQWLRHGETGFLVQMGDIQGFARAILRLLRDPGLAMRMGRAGRCRVNHLFRAETHLTRLEAIYQEVRCTNSGSDQ